MAYSFKHQNATYLALILFIVVMPFSLAHSTIDSENAYVRVVESNPGTNTYTFSCSMNPENNYARDFFIREDSGDFSIPLDNEAEILDVPAGEFITYTFENDGFYHVGCVIVNNSDFSQQFRGDVHIDLRDSDWNPQINLVNAGEKEIELTCDYSGGDYVVSWEVLDAQTGEVSNLGSEKTIVHTVENHGLYDYICKINSGSISKSTGLPIEFFDSGEAYFPDEYGVPHGVENVWMRDSTGNHDHGIYYVGEGELIPAISFDIKNDSTKYYLDINIANLNLVEKAGEPRVEGEGHLHWYLDGVRQGRIYSDYFELPSISEGVHEIILTASTNDHKEYYHGENRIESVQEFNFVKLNQETDNEIEPPVFTGETGLLISDQNGLEVEYTCKPEGSSNNLVVDWNFGDGNFVYDVSAKQTHTYSGEGFYYVQCDSWDNEKAEFISLSSYFEINSEGSIIEDDTNQTQPPTNETDENPNDETEQQEYYNLENIPATCSGGTIVSDEYFGGRAIECSNSNTGAKLNIEAWDKPNSFNPEYFEMYKKAHTGSGIEICIAETCISGNGFAKSNNYPILFSESGEEEPVNDTEVPTNESDNGTEPIQEQELALLSLNNLEANYMCKPEGSSNDLIVDWNFGDGNFVYDTDYNILHQYSGTGSYYVFCGVWDNEKAQYTSFGNHFDITSANFDGGSEPPTNETDENPNDETEQQEYYNLENIPATCSGGTIVSDEYFGGRAIECSNSNTGAKLNIEAWDKPNSFNPEYFEMYKKAHTGSGIEICIAETCISGNGFAKSNNYPILFSESGEEEPVNDTEVPTNGAISILNKPIWLSHSGTTNVAVDYFHFEVNEAQNKSIHVSTDWEVWDKINSENIWTAYSATGLSRYHVHTPDGVFKGSLEGESQLEHDKTYRAKARFKHINGSFTEWSEWREFTTASEQVAGEGDPTWTVAQGFSVEKFAEGLDVPVHVIAASNLYASYPQSERPFLYVTELYGKIKVIYEDGSQSVYADNLLNFDPFGSITGGGQMGLIGLVVEPITGDLFASMVYIDREDEDTIKNKIVRFHSTDDGKSYSSSAIIIDGLPSAPSHQIEQLTIHNGRLYVNLGDAQAVSDVQKEEVLVGKIISMNLDGSDVQVYAKGFRNPFGADWSNSGVLYVTDNAPDVNDRLIKVSEGENYGWGMNDNFATFNEKRIATLNVSPVDVEFNYDSEFANELYGRLYVAVAGPIYQEGPTNGKEILEFTLNSNGEVQNRRNFVYYTGTGYGTPMGLEFHKGALYFTDIYGEAGFVGLGETEGVIYRVVAGESSPDQNEGEFRAGLSILPWYPKDSGEGIVYIFECVGIDGSGDYTYYFDLGDGNQSGATDQKTKYHTYSYGDTDYVVTCNVHDNTNSEVAHKSIVINPSKFIAE